MPVLVDIWPFNLACSLQVSLLFGQTNDSLLRSIGILVLSFWSLY